jgi:hypothetical protein
MGSRRGARRYPPQGGSVSSASGPGCPQKARRPAGGQKQRVAIAPAVLEPTLLLLGTARRARPEAPRAEDRVEGAAGSFGTTFVITHDQSGAGALRPHVAVMSAGRFEQGRHTAGLCIIRRRHSSHRSSARIIASAARWRVSMARSPRSIRRPACESARGARRARAGQPLLHSSAPSHRPRAHAAALPASMQSWQRGRKPALRQRQLGGARAKDVSRHTFASRCPRRGPPRIVPGEGSSSASSRRAPSASAWRHHDDRRAAAPRARLVLMLLLAPALLWLVGLITAARRENAICRARAEPRVATPKTRPVPDVLPGAALLAFVRYRTIDRRHAVHLRNRRSRGVVHRENRRGRSPKSCSSCCVSFRSG